MNQGLFEQIQKLFKSSDILMSIGVIGIMLVMVVPLNPFVLDLMLVLSLGSSIAILLLSIYAKRPLDFSVFPSILLITTLYRLALNVASTRLILAHGHMGSAAAGSLIKSFGEFVVGGNFVVGFIVFVILVIINFIVITKGAGRVSEVAARFTLDALPGKQMAIDADLNAGIINQADAKKRRKEVESEADFYGSMDGASKFVRGDAIAGLLVTVINIVGGLIVGMAQKGLPFATAAKNYTLLTVGDGLVAQVPALIISTAAGLIVTRSASDEGLSNQVSKQIFYNEKVMFVLAGALFGMGLFLQDAFLPFLILSAVSLGGGFLMKNYKVAEASQTVTNANAEALDSKDKNIEPTGAVDVLQLEVGYGLISIVDSSQKGDLLDRIQAVRKQFAQEFGIVVPPMSIRDNLQLKPGEYVLMVRGVETARGDLMVDHFLAMDPGGITDPVEGVPTKEPVFNLDALWIHENNKEVAQLAGYTVVDLPTVIATHITEIIRKHGHELIGRQEVQTLIEYVQKTHPKVVEELVPKELNLGAVVRVLQNLLKEGVPIKDLVSILETLADSAQVSKDIDFLTESVRGAQKRHITARLLDESGELPLMTFSRQIEEQLIGAVQPGEKTGSTQFLVDPALVKQVIPVMSKVVEKVSSDGVTPILLVTPMIRHHVKKLLERFLPQVVVLSHNEISPQLRIKSVANIEV
jgi:flagellar biosynthesis protein FlhA